MSGFNAERTFGTSLGLTQVLFSDDVLTGVDTQRLVQLSLEHELEQLRLDVTLDSAQAYLNLLRAETFERIQRDNLKLTRNNLELARTRESIGVSGASEVYRWESQIATSQKNVLEAQSTVTLSRIALNRLRHRPLDEPFVTQETGLDDPSLSVSADPFLQYLDNTRAVEVFQDLLVQEGMNQAPELMALEALIGAQQRVRLNAKRAQSMPDVLASAGVNHRLTESGAGADALRARPDDDTEWTASLSLAFPLYAGGAKRAELMQATEELARLKLVRKSVTEQIEQRVRSAVHVAVTSFRSIQLTRAAADAARKNLALVMDAYSRGVLSILDLLDAQNAALVAELSASNVVFDFLVDLMEVQRAVGRFDFLLPQDQQTQWLNKLKQRFESSVSNP
jgi:outer membrane protein TolC